MEAMQAMQLQMQAMQAELQHLRAAQAAGGVAPTPTPIVVQSAPSAADVANEFAKIGKINSYNGDENKWHEWEFNLLAHIGAFSPQLVALMEAAKRSLVQIPRSSDPDIHQNSSRLFAMLAKLCTDKAHKIIRRCEMNNGLEAWRMLCSSCGTEVDEIGATGLMNRLLNYRFGSQVSEVMEHLNNFRLMLKTHDEAPTTEPIQDQVIKTVVVNNMPEPLLTHLRLNQTRFTSSSQAMNAVEDYCRTVVRAAGGPTPMELDYVGKGDKKGKNGRRKGDKKGKDGGKGDKRGKAKQDGKQKTQKFEG